MSTVERDLSIRGIGATVEQGKGRIEREIADQFNETLDNEKLSVTKGEYKTLLRAQMICEILAKQIETAKYDSDVIDLACLLLKVKRPTINIKGDMEF